MNRLPTLISQTRCSILAHSSPRRSIAALQPGTFRPSPTPCSPSPIRAAARAHGTGHKTTSSPKSAEEASATSGGSRSKEAVETGSSPTAGAIPDTGADADAAAAGSDVEAPPPDRAGDGSTGGGGGGRTPDARGRTGGGPPLASSHAAPAPPKISNASVPGGRPPRLSPEQQAEVDEHNRDFESSHGKADPAEDDKVDKDFWSGVGSRFNKY